MAKLTDQTNYLSGIEVLPYYLYELSLYKYWKNGCCLLASRFYKSDLPIIFTKSCVTEQQGEFLIEKSISLIGAPEEYIKSLPKSETKKRKKK